MFSVRPCSSVVGWLSLFLGDFYCWLLIVWGSSLVFLVCGLLVGVCRWLVWELFVVSCLFYCGSLFRVRCLLMVVGCLLFVVCGFLLLFVVYCLVFVVCGCGCVCVACHGVLLFGVACCCLFCAYFLCYSLSVACVVWCCCV